MSLGESQNPFLRNPSPTRDSFSKAGVTGQYPCCPAGGTGVSLFGLLLPRSGPYTFSYTKCPIGVEVELSSSRSQPRLCQRPSTHALRTVGLALPSPSTRPGGAPKEHVRQMMRCNCVIALGRAPVRSVARGSAICSSGARPLHSGARRRPSSSRRLDERLFTAPSPSSRPTPSRGACHALWTSLGGEQGGDRDPRDSADDPDAVRTDWWDDLFPTMYPWNPGCVGTSARPRRSRAAGSCRPSLSRPSQHLLLIATGTTCGPRSRQSWRARVPSSCRGK